MKRQDSEGNREWGNFGVGRLPTGKSKTNKNLEGGCMGELEGGPVPKLKKKKNHQYGK